MHIDTYSLLAIKSTGCDQQQLRNRSGNVGISHSLQSHTHTQARIGAPCCTHQSTQNVRHTRKWVKWEKDLGYLHIYNKQEESRFWQPTDLTRTESSSSCLIEFHALSSIVHLPSNSEGPTVMGAVASLEFSFAKISHPANCL